MHNALSFRRRVFAFQIRKCLTSQEMAHHCGHLQKLPDFNQYPAEPTIDKITASLRLHFWIPFCIDFHECPYSSAGRATDL